MQVAVTQGAGRLVGSYILFSIHSRARSPAAPTGLVVSTAVVIPEIPRILAAFKTLNDSFLLTEARGYSRFYDWSIIRWVNRRGYLIYRNAVQHGCARNEIYMPTKGDVSTSFVPEVNPEVLLDCSTLGDVRELAKFEQTTLTNSDQGRDRVERDIDLSLGALPRQLYPASLVANTLLVFVIVYFAAYAREASSSKGFPAPGTLFRAFSRSRWTLAIMFLALWIPFLASLLLAITSRRWPLGFESTLVFGAVALAYVNLQKRKFFGALIPPRWRRSQAST